MVCLDGFQAIEEYNEKRCLVSRIYPCTRINKCLPFARRFLCELSFEISIHVTIFIFFLLTLTFYFT